MTSVLLQTIEADLKAGVSYFEKEAEDVGMWLCNTVKAAFVALEPAEAAVLRDVLLAGVAAASSAHSVEQIESAVLNTAKTDELAVLTKAGSNVVQTVIAALRPKA